MSDDDDRHAELIREQIERLFHDLARVTHDPYEVVEFSEKLTERMKRELAEE